MAGYVYEQTITPSRDGGMKLQFFGHEEGRVRIKADANNNVIGYNFDYFIKDHLGNVRMVLTDESQTDAYPVASLETAPLSNEKTYYSIPDAARTDRTTIPGYPTNDTYTNPNQWIQKLKGDATKIGTGIVLKVMSGDKVNIRANSWWTNNSIPASSANTASPLTDIVNSLIIAVPGASGSKIASGQLSNTILSPSVTDLLNNRNTNNYVSTKPKAYLNWVLLDEQFNEVLTNDGRNSGFEQVGADNEFKTHTKSGIELSKNGYLYVYVSNESTDINVFFDNLQVTHLRGPLVEETHYYPFGLTMNGISSKAAGAIQNRNKFNGGNELQNGEFSDGSGLEVYDAKNRMYDPQLGKFFQIDEFGEVNGDVSSYSFGHNNPIIFNDPLGLIDGLPGEKPAVLDEVVVKSYTKNQTQQVYWDLRNNNTSFDRVSNNPLRERLQNYDNVQRFMEGVHKQTHEQDMIALEVASFLVPAGELVEAGRLGKAAITLYKFKRGLHLASGAADLTGQLIVNRGDLRSINPVSTLSATIIGNPLLSSIPGAFVNLSLNGISTNSILSSPTNLYVYKTIALSTLGNFYGAKMGEGLQVGSTLPIPNYTGQTFINTGAGVINEMTNNSKK